MVAGSEPETVRVETTVEADMTDDRGGRPVCVVKELVRPWGVASLRVSLVLWGDVEIGVAVGEGEV